MYSDYLKRKADDSASTDSDREHSPPAVIDDCVLQRQLAAAGASPFSPHSESAPDRSESSSSSSSSSSTSAIAAHCELCDESHAASHRCGECEQSMCLALVGVHRKMRGTMHHCLVPIAHALVVDSGASAASEVCTGDQHVSTIEFFDFHCSLLLCSNCVLSHTQAHSSRIELLAAAAPCCLAEIKTLSLKFQQWHGNIDETVLQCKQRDAEVLAEKAYLVDQIEQTCQQIKDAADERCGLLKYHLQERFAIKADQLDSQIQKWTHFGARLHAERKRVFAVATSACNASTSNASCAKIYQDYQCSLSAEMRAAPPLVAQSQVAALEAPVVPVQQTELCALDNKAVMKCLAAIRSIQLDQYNADDDASEVDHDTDDDYQDDSKSIDCGKLVHFDSMKDDHISKLTISSALFFESDRFVAVKKISRSAAGTGYQLIVSNAQGEVQFEFGTQQLALGSHYFCAAVTSDQCVVISMSGKNENCLLVFKLTAGSGTFVRQIGSWGTKPGKLNKPMGLAITTSGLIFVADSLNHRVQVFRLADGAQVRSFGTLGNGAAQFDEPVNVCLSVDEQFVFVCDSQNHRVLKFNLHGKLIATAGEYGNDDGQFDDPSCAVVLPGGSIIVADTNNHRLQIFDQDFKHLRTVRVTNQKRVRAFVPLFMTLSPAGQLYVKCEQMNSFIVFQLNDLKL